MNNSAMYACSLTLVAFLILLSGCQNSPGALLSPVSDIHVSKTDPALVQPEEDSGSETSSTSTSSTASGTSSTASSTTSTTKVPPTTTISQVNFYFRITNGVSVFLNTYTVAYFDSKGASLANGRYNYSSGLSLFVQAPEMVTLAEAAGGSSSSSGDSSSSSGGTGTSGGSATAGQATSIRLQSSEESSSGTGVEYAGVVPLQILSSGVYSYMYYLNMNIGTARVTFSGVDVNGRDVNFSSLVTMSTTMKKSEDSSN